MKKLILIFLISAVIFPVIARAAIIFQDDFDNWPSDWVCNDGGSVPVVNGWSSSVPCAHTNNDGFGSELKIGAGRTGNALYLWKKDFTIVASATAGAGTGDKFCCAAQNLCPGGLTSVGNWGYPTCYKLYDASANFGSETPVFTTGLDRIYSSTHNGIPGQTGEWDRIVGVGDANTLYTQDNWWAPGQSYTIHGIADNYRAFLTYTFSGNYTELYQRYYVNVPVAFNKSAAWAGEVKLWRMHTNGTSNGAIYFSVRAGSQPGYKIRDGSFDFKADGGASIFSTGIPLSTVADGTWHSVEFHLKLNDPGTANGVAEMWIDGGSPQGTPNYSKTNINWSTYFDNTNHFTDVYHFPEGNDSPEPWDMTTWTGIAYDDYVISNSYIGPVGGAPDTTPPAAPTGVTVI